MLVQQPNPGQDELATLRKERRAARASRRKQQRRAKVILWSAISLSAIMLIVMGYFYVQIEYIVAHPRPVFATINGISCDTGEQSSYHIHAHVSIYINGKAVQIPKSIGIENTGNYACFYWMHTHTSDGILHIEAPQKLHNLALDDFLTIWQIGFPKLGFPAELLQQTGWQIYVNGKPFTGTKVTSPLITEVPLNSHDVVTMEYGTPIVPPDKFFAFPPTLPR